MSQQTRDTHGGWVDMALFSVRNFLVMVDDAERTLRVNYGSKFTA